MKKFIILLSLLFLCSKAYGASLLLNGDLYVTTNSIKVGKESTNRFHYFNSLTPTEQRYLLTHPAAHTRNIKGTPYINVTTLTPAIEHRGYGIITCAKDCRVEDRENKKYSAYTTYEESGTVRDNSLHEPTILHISQEAPTKQLGTIGVALLLNLLSNF